MSGRQSAATDKALRMVLRGSTIAHAARKCGVSWVTIWRALKRAGIKLKR